MKLNLIVLKTNKLKEVVDFYRELGLVFQPEQHGNEPIHFSATADGVVLEIYSYQEPDSSNVIGFYVDNLIDIILDRAYSPILITNGEATSSIYDPDGRKVFLTQRRICK